MSDQIDESKIEIDGDITSDKWKQVKSNAREIAHERLDVLTTSLQTGVRMFQRDAKTLVDEVIKAPPPKPVSVFGAIAEGLLDVVVTVIPEGKEAKEFFEAAKAIYEGVKNTVEALQKAQEEIVAQNVDDAKKKMTKLADDMADAMDTDAPRSLQTALRLVDGDLDAYYQANPQPLDLSESFYGKLCDGIGIRDLDATDTEMKVWTALFNPYKVKVLQVEATLHFLKEMDNDVERLDMLMDAAKQGTDPEELVVYIGGDINYWRPFLETFKSDGRDAAIAQLERHLLGWQG
jgi:hypothetical protein